MMTVAPCQGEVDSHTVPGHTGTPDRKVAKYANIKTQNPPIFYNKCGNSKKISANPKCSS